MYESGEEDVLKWFQNAERMSREMIMEVHVRSGRNKKGENQR